LATQAGSLFVLHLNIFTMNNLAKQKPLTLSEASQTTEGLVQHCIGNMAGRRMNNRLHIVSS
ncbi:hypothetical protein, partial [Terrimonas pollutisoli]|uniref:hypothetical protein n=1 Tax=Terrimonas pollutisoli TaxID=3034147 RepID=UPI0023EDB128